MIMQINWSLWHVYVLDLFEHMLLPEGALFCTPFPTSKSPSRTLQVFVFVSYLYITNHHIFRDLKQQTLSVSQFLWVRSPDMACRVLCWDCTRAQQRCLPALRSCLRLDWKRIWFCGQNSVPSACNTASFGFLSSCWPEAPLVLGGGLHPPLSLAPNTNSPLLQSHHGAGKRPARCMLWCYGTQSHSCRRAGPLCHSLGWKQVIGPAQSQGAMQGTQAWISRSGSQGSPREFIDVLTQ